MSIEVTKPGIYEMPIADYHRDPVPSGSLSFSRAKTLLEEAGPAKFRHRETSRREEKSEFDFGNLVHALVLGKGLERLTVIDAKDWRTKSAQQKRDAAYIGGTIPVLAWQVRTAEAMAEAVDAHAQAREVLAGEHEKALFWQQGDGLWLRGQLDVYAPGSHIGDYKTCVDASGPGFARSAWRYRYYMQAAWYRRMVQELTGELLPFRLVAQEKAAPYLVSVWEPTAQYLELGDADMGDAIEIYQHCMKTGRWPGYDEAIQDLSPPDWALEDEIEIGE